jgi:hypothetical protein
MSDFLPNAMSQLDADHFGLDKVKRRLTAYFAVAHLRALIVQEAEMEQVKAQEVVLKDTIEDQIRISHPRPLSGQERHRHRHQLRWRYKGA